MQILTSMQRIKYSLRNRDTNFRQRKHENEHGGELSSSDKEHRQITWGNAVSWNKYEISKSTDSRDTETTKSERK